LIFAGTANDKKELVMANITRRKTDEKVLSRAKRKRRIFSKTRGTAEKPRLVVFRSNRNFSLQIIDDAKGHTLAAASTLEEEFKGKVCSNIEAAKEIGALIAKRAMAKEINSVVFDRSGYLYHGRIKALAEAAREAGLQF
jgi:large subunit ribosomal protein L18